MYEIINNNNNNKIIKHYGYLSKVIKKKSN
jgi:hypothetical protein